MSKKQTRSEYIATLEPFDATMHAYYHVSALKKLVRGSATEPLDRLTEYELHRIFDNVLFQILQIGRSLDAKENTHEFFDMVYDDRALPDVPGSITRAQPANIR